MAELTSQDRLQPSLLDRLIDHEPRNTKESSEARALTRTQLRAAVLRDLGWNLYRVWGAAWYRDRAEEEARLRAAIEQAALPGRGPSRRPDLLQLLPVS